MLVQMLEEMLVELLVEMLVEMLEELLVKMLVIICVEYVCNSLFVCSICKPLVKLLHMFAKGFYGLDFTPYI